MCCHGDREVASSRHAPTILARFDVPVCTYSSLERFLRDNEAMTTRERLIVAAFGVGVALQMISTSSLQGQIRPDSVHGDKTFFTRRDAVLTGVAVAGTVALSAFDERIGHWMQSSSVQGDSSRRNLFDNLTHLNETPLTLGAIATYGIGRLVRSETVADVGLHWTEAIVLNNVVSELIRGPLGRNGRESRRTTLSFRVRGRIHEVRGPVVPSLHSSSAFATAAALIGEVHEAGRGSRGWSARFSSAPRDSLAYAHVSGPALGERRRLRRVRRDTAGAKWCTTRTRTAVRSSIASYWGRRLSRCRAAWRSRCRSSNRASAGLNSVGTDQSGRGDGRTRTISLWRDRLVAANPNDLSWGPPLGTHPIAS